MCYLQDNVYIYIYIFIFMMLVDTRLLQITSGAVLSASVTQNNRRSEQASPSPDANDRACGVSYIYA